MATFRSTVLALLGALGIVVSGCASVPLTTPQKQQPAAGASAPAAPVASAPPAVAKQQQPTAAAAATGVVSLTTTKVVGDFPTSKAKAEGKDWDVMHKDSYTGSLAVTCKLLGLTTSQCRLYETKRSDNSCVVMSMPNGIVLDRLGFTDKAGKHHVQSRVKVALKDPPTRTAQVCDLGGGVVVGTAHGCGNPFMVTGWKKPIFTEVTQSGASVSTSASCAEPAWMQINVWGAKALDVPGVRTTIDATRPTPGSYYVANRVSRMHGATFRSLNAKGELNRSVRIHPFTVYLVKKDSTEHAVDGGNLIGEKRIPMPVGFAEGDVIKILFAGEQGLVSPLSGDLRAQFKEFHPCGTHLHAIESAAR